MMAKVKNGKFVGRMYVGNRASDSGSEGRGFESRRGHCLQWCFPPQIVLCKRRIGRKRDGADRGC